MLKILAIGSLILAQQINTGHYRHVYSGGGPSTPTYVGSAVNGEAGNIVGLVMTITYTPAAAGHALYIFAAVGTGTITSLTDSAGSPSVVTSPVTWNVANGSGVYESWRESGAATGSHTITLNVASGSTYGVLYVVELSNSSAAGNTSISSVGNSSANPIPCGSLTTSSGSIALAFGYVFDAAVTLSGGSGPPSFTFPTPSGSGLAYAGMEYSGATIATTYTISSGFVPTSTGDSYFCYALEAKP